MTGPDALTAAPAGTRVLRGFLPFALAYLISFLFRNVNAVAGPAIAADLGVDQVALGVLTSAYFATFAAVQLPLGIALDRFGPHRTEAVLLLFAAGGAALFAAGPDVATLAAGRGLIGVGVSAGLMAAFKANALYWPPARLATVNGCVLAFGGLGAALATVPVQIVLGQVSWRVLFWGLAAAAAAIAAALALAAPARPPGPAAHPPPLLVQAREIGHVFANRLFWRVAPLIVATQAVWFSYLGLWAGPWLREAAGFAPEAAAGALFAASVAIIPGFLFSGASASWFVRRGRPSAPAFVGWAAGFMVVQALLVAGVAGAATVPLWAAFSALGTGTVVGYPMLTRAFPPSLSGRVNTAVNLPVFVAAFLAQAAIGPALAALGPALGPALGSGGAHAAVIGALLAVQAAALAWFLADPRARRL